VRAEAAASVVGGAGLLGGELDGAARTGGLARRAGRRWRAAARARPSDGGEATAPAGRVAGEGGEQRVHRGPARGGVGGEAALDDAEQPGGGVGRALGAGELAALDGGEEGVAAVAGERADAQEGLVEGDAEAEDVAARVGLAAGELLGGHVRGGAEDGAGDGEAGVGGRGRDGAGELGLVEGGWSFGQVVRRRGAVRGGEDGGVERGGRRGGEDGGVERGGW
jgi:hypothetical protein